MDFKGLIELAALGALGYGAYWVSRQPGGAMGLLTTAWDSFLNGVT